MRGFLSSFFRAIGLASAGMLSLIVILILVIIMVAALCSPWEFDLPDLIMGVTVIIIGVMVAVWEERRRKKDENS